MRAFLFLIFLTLVSCSGITSYNDQIFPAYEAYIEGDLNVAADIAGAIADENYQSNSRVIFQLESGTMLRDAGLYLDAFQAFELAEATLKAGYDERSALHYSAIAENAASVLVNQKNLAYLGTVSDRVLLNTYKALCMFELGELDNALVEARRIDQAQQRAEQFFKNEYDAVKEAGNAQGYVLDMEALYRDEQFISANKDLFFSQGISDFRNPFATYVIGLLRRIAPENGESPAFDFNWLAERIPNNRFIIKEQKKIDSGIPPTGSVYVIFENGVGPFLRQQLIRIPRGIYRNTIQGPLLQEDYIALPKLISGKPAANFLKVSGANKMQLSTSLIADMNKIVRYEFSQRYPKILRKELFSASIKGLIFSPVEAYAEEQLNSDREEDNPLLGALMLFGTNFTKKMIAQADDRAWKSIASNYQIAHFDRDDLESITLSLSNDQVAKEVPLPDAEVVVIFARSVHSSHLNVRTYLVGEITME